MFFKKKSQQNVNREELLSNIEETDVQEDPSMPNLSERKKLPGWAIIPLLAIFGLVILGLFKMGDGSSPSTSVTLRVTEVTTGTVTETYNASGKIESEDTKTYYSPVSAPIIQYTARVGDTVQAGDLLVRFDTTNLERDNQQAQLSLQASLNSSAATRTKNAQAIDIANATSAQAADNANRLADKVNSLAQQIATAKQNAGAITEQLNTLQSEIHRQTQIISDYESTINNVNATYDRTQYTVVANKPEESRTIEEQNLFLALDSIYQKYDDAVTKLPEASASLTALQTEYDTLSSSVAGLTSLQTEYDTAYVQWENAYASATAPTTAPGITSSELESLKISDNLAELSALTPAELVEKGKAGMVSDMNGVIASAEAIQTNAATQGMAMFSIANMDKVRVQIETSPDDYGKMKIGNTASISVGEYKYTGSLTRVGKIATKNEKGNPVIATEIHINNPDTNLCIGATAKVKMTIAEANDVLIVPTESINTATDGDFVYVIENGTVVKKPVELGTASATQIEVKRGLKKGDQVVTDLSVDIKEGMKASPLTATTEKETTTNN